MDYEVLPNVGCPADFDQLLISKKVPGAIVYTSEHGYREHACMALFGLRVGPDYRIAKCYQNPDTQYIVEQLNDRWGWQGGHNPIHDWMQLSFYYRYWWVGFGSQEEMQEFINKNFKIIECVYRKNRGTQ